MALETRGGSRYYYRKERNGARVRSVYAGAGEIGAAYAALDDLDRAERNAERAQHRAQIEAWRREERDARQLAQAAQEIERAALCAAGYHQHKRQWRKRRMSTKALVAGLEETAERQRAKAHRDKAQSLGRAAAEQLAGGEDNFEARRALLARCNRSDAAPEDVAALRALIAKRPALADGVHPIRDALDQEIDAIGYALKRELVRANLDQRRAELGYADAPALERGLIDWLLLCEMRLGNAERFVTAMVTVRGTPIPTVNHVEARLSAAGRRYLAAVESLARVRRVRVELTKIAPDGSAQAVAVEGPGR